MKTILVFSLLLAFSLSQSCCSDGTVTVSGNADVKVKADIAKLTVYVQDTQKTTSEALSNVNQKIASVVALLQKNNIPTKDYSTSSFSIQSQYDYSSGERIFTGYKASQSLTVTLRSLTQDGAEIGKIVTGVSLIKGATVNGVSFQQSDSRLGVKQARKAAYQSALEKAQEYARLSGLTLRDPLRIESVNVGNVVPFFAEAAAFRTSPAANLLVPVRDVTVSAGVNVVFSLLP